MNVPIPREWRSWCAIWSQTERTVASAAAFLDHARHSDWRVFECLDATNPDPREIDLLFIELAYVDRDFDPSAYVDMLFNWMPDDARVQEWIGAEASVGYFIRPMPHMETVQ